MGIGGPIPAINQTEVKILQKLSAEHETQTPLFHVLTTRFSSSILFLQSKFFSGPEISIFEGSEIDLIGINSRIRGKLFDVLILIIG